MVQGIGTSGAGRAAIEAALRKLQTRAEGARELESRGAGAADVSGAQESQSFAEALRAGVESVDESIQRTENLHVEVLKGNLDIHEVAAQLKESELTFEFALQVRNKLLDAYREVMRMTV